MALEAIQFLGGKDLAFTQLNMWADVENVIFYEGLVVLARIKPGGSPSELLQVTAQPDYQGRIQSTVAIETVQVIKSNGLAMLGPFIPDGWRDINGLLIMEELGGGNEIEIIPVRNFHAPYPL